MKTVLTLFFITLYYASFSQTNCDSIIISKLPRIQNQNDTIFYTKNSFESIYAIREVFKHDSIFTNNSDTLIFSKKQINFILDKANQNINYQWGKDLFNKSYLIDSSIYITKFLNQRNSKKNSGLIMAHCFSKPIIFNNDYALVSISSLIRGNWGWSDCYILKKTDNEWDIYMRIYSASH